MVEYTWSSKPCVRFHSHIEGEGHPCYYCGTPIPIEVGMETCKKCGFAVCPSCRGCICNQPDHIHSSLERLRDRFCCNRRHFEIGFFLESNNQDRRDLLRVPHFVEALDYCRRITRSERTKFWRNRSSDD